MKAAATTEDKKNKERQQAAYRRADWALVISCTARGGGAARMVKRGS